jgi:hypothetical protein
VSAARFKGEEHYGPGSCGPDAPKEWCRGVYWTTPVTRRTMRRRVVKALANPKLTELVIRQVPDG